MTRQADLPKGNVYALRAAYRQRVAVERLAGLSDARTRLVHADVLRAAGIGRLLAMPSDDKAMEYLRSLAEAGAFERVMPPGRAGLECSFRLPRNDSAARRNVKDPTALYRLFDVDDVLLYVGITCDPIARFEDHAKKAWWPQVARRTIRWFPDRPEAAERELKAIWSEGPRFNNKIRSLSTRGARR